MSKSKILASNPRLWVPAVVAGFVAILLGLYFIQPEAVAYFPKCLFFYATGLHCPGCGSARCLHSLLHGDIRQAAAYNSLVLAFFPFLVYAGLRTVHAALKNRPWRIPLWSIRLLLFSLVAYWILRNLNAEPFQLLAPHRL